MDTYKTLDLDRLKQEFNLDDSAIETCGFSKQELQDIYSDYLDKSENILENYKNSFLSDYIISADGIRFHSYSGRVKDPYHLIEKIVRKRNNNNTKYGKMQVDDYYKYITDLIGCRILVVYKNDWKKIHDYLTNTFVNDPNKYIENSKYVEGYLKRVKPDEKPYIAEEPVAYIRAGDEERLYSEVNNIKLDRKGYYRSVHYIVRYREYYVEIQVRSLFEEAWGEVDHDVLYPLYKDDEELVRFSTLLNRMAGLGDEMSAYFKDHVQRNMRDKSLKPENNRLLDTPDLFGVSNIVQKEDISDSVEESVPINESEPITPNDMIKQIILE